MFIVFSICYLNDDLPFHTQNDLFDEKGGHIIHYYMARGDMPLLIITLLFVLLSPVYKSPVYEAKAFELVIERLVSIGYPKVS